MSNSNIDNAKLVSLADGLSNAAAAIKDLATDATDLVRGEPREKAVLDTIKNWDHIREIKFSCESEVFPGEGGDYNQKAETDNCTITVTFADSKKQEHTGIMKSGGVVKQGSVVSIYKSGFFQ